MKTRSASKEKRLTIVQKYGGSSLANPDYINRIARNIVKKKEEGVDLVVVVSAMGKTTDEFIRLAHAVNPNPDRRELDMLLSVGERMSISLVALAINSIGKYNAISFTGSQIGIITDTNHTQARILEVKGHRLREALKEDKIVVVAGFQGVSVNKEITTLARGGSDTTAVALAAALDADYCEIMSDVDGIYSADPNKISSAQRIDRLHYDQALEMASAGAKMLNSDSVDFAKRHNVKLSLGSSFTGHVGTIVTDEEMNSDCVTGVVADPNIVILRFSTPEEKALVLPHSLSKAQIRIKIWQCVRGLGVIGVSQNDVSLAQRHLQEIAERLVIQEGWALLSIIGTGVGLGSHSAEEVFSTLQRLNIHFDVVLSGELYLKILVPAEMADQACKELHDVFITEQEKNSN